MAPRLRVAIDGTVMGERLTGAGRVAKNLIATLPVVDPDVDYCALVLPNGSEHVPASGLRTEVVPAKRGLQLELWSLGRVARRVGTDVLLTFREIVGLTNPPTLLHLFEPPAYRLQRVTRRPPKHVAKDMLLHTLLKRSVRRAGAVTAGAEATAAWLERRYGIRPPVITPGIDDAFLIGPEGREEAHPPYFVHIAAGDPRDNTDLVLAAFAQADVPDAELRLVGASAPHIEWLRLRAASLGIGRRVRIQPWVPDRELVQIYRGAVALIQAAAYESFGGLPSLEAMGVGTPVIGLEAPGVREALHEAALLVKEPRPAAVASALTRIRFDPALRASLSELGWERVRTMSWRETARRFARVIHEVGRRRGGV